MDARSLRLWAAWGLVLGTGLSACKLNPTITDIDPAAARPGEKVVIRGTGMESPTGIEFHDGQSASSYQKVDSNTVMATVPAGARTGPVGLKTGPSDAYRSGTWLSPFDFTVIKESRAETESNDDFDEANPVSSGFQEITGELPRGSTADVDWFRIESGPAGENVTAYLIELAVTPSIGGLRTTLYADNERTGDVALDQGRLLQKTSNQPYSIWICLEPEAEFFAKLQLTLLPVGQEEPPRYTVGIARLPIHEPVEPDNDPANPDEQKLSGTDLQNARLLVLDSDGLASTTDSYLRSELRGKSVQPTRDVFKISNWSGRELLVIATAADAYDRGVGVTVAVANGVLSESTTTTGHRTELKTSVSSVSGQDLYVVVQAARALDPWGTTEGEAALYKQPYHLFVLMIP